MLKYDPKRVYPLTFFTTSWSLSVGKNISCNLVSFSLIIKKTYNQNCQVEYKKVTAKIHINSIDVNIDFKYFKDLDALTVGL